MSTGVKPGAALVGLRRVTSRLCTDRVTTAVGGGAIG